MNRQLLIGVLYGAALGIALSVAGMLAQPKPLQMSCEPVLVDGSQRLMCQ